MAETRSFADRHRFALILLWFQIPVLAVLGLARHEPVGAIAATSLLLIAFGLLAMFVKDESLAATATAFGLISTSAVFVYFTNGLPGSNFHLIVMLIAIAFYRNLFALVGATVYGVGLYFAALAANILTLSETALRSAFATAAMLALIAGWHFVRNTASESDDRFRLSFDESSIGMAVLKPSGEFVEVNTAMAGVLGYDINHFTGANIRSIAHRDDLGELGEAWEEMGNSESHKSSFWMRCTNAIGGAVWGRVTLALVPRTEGHPAMVTLQIEEASSSFIEQQRLENLLAAKDRFVATVGEEIKAPLDVLIDLTSEPATDVAAMEGPISEVASVLADLVASARTGQGPPPIPRQVGVGFLCRTVLDALPGADDVDLTGVAGSFWADPTPVAHILKGLVGNALRYGGRQVSIKSAASGPDTVIQVIDDGTAIPEADRERIFEGDLRTARTVTSPAAVGLNLTVGRRLARQMDGEVTYRRSSDGENVFELRLPSEPLDPNYSARPDREEVAGSAF